MAGPSLTAIKTKSRYGLGIIEVSSFRSTTIKDHLCDSQCYLTYPAPRVEPTGQQLISHEGLSTLDSLLNALEC